MTIRYCNCEKSRRVANGSLGQLLDNAWYPATTIDPETCATLGVLEWFRMLNVVGNVSAHDFVGALERKMDPLRVSSVPVRWQINYAEIFKALIEPGCRIVIKCSLEWRASSVFC
jgi:hypothetical protein